MPYFPFHILLSSFLFSCIRINCILPLCQYNIVYILSDESGKTWQACEQTEPELKVKLQCCFCGKALALVRSQQGTIWQTQQTDGYLWICDFLCGTLMNVAKYPIIQSPSPSMPFLHIKTHQHDVLAEWPHAAHHNRFGHDRLKMSQCLWCLFRKAHL